MLHRRIAPIVVALALTAASCAPTGGGSDARSQAPVKAGVPKRMVALIRGEPFTLNSATNSGATGQIAGTLELSQAVNVRLAYVANRSIQGLRIAESAPTTENGLWKVFPDGRMETTWKLRSDATWHDGKPVVPADFLFAAQVGQDKEFPSLRATAYSAISSFDTPDARTIVIQWKQPFVEADTWFGNLEPMPKHILEPLLASDKSNFLNSAYFTKEFVGTGPLKMKEWAANSHMVLQAYDSYFLGRTRIDELEVKFVLDPNVAIANLLAGTADLTLGRGISLDQGLQAKDQWKDGRVDVTYSGWTAMFPQFLNPEPQIIGNQKFRQALMYGLDRQVLSDVFSRGLVEVPHNFVAPGTTEFQDTRSAAQRYDYDPRKSAQLIEELGYTKRADGNYYDPGGTALTFMISTTGDDDWKEGLMLATADQWKRLGYGTTPNVIPRLQAQDLEYRSNLPFQIVRQGADLAEATLKRYTSKEAALPANQYRGTNRGRYANPGMDALVEKYITTIPRTERIEVGRSIVKLMTTDLPAMGLSYTSEPVFISNRVANVDAEKNTAEIRGWDVK